MLFQHLDIRRLGEGSEHLVTETVGPARRGRGVGERHAAEIDAADNPVRDRDRHRVETDSARRIVPVFGVEALQPGLKLFQERPRGGLLVGSYLSRLENYYRLITKALPIFSMPNSKKMRYQLDDCFLIFWFRFFYKYQSLVENKALKTLDAIIQRDYSTVSGFMMERYFAQKFEEEGKYIIGKWWDRKGENEIDLIVADPLKKEAWIYELKKQGERYDAKALKEKVKVVVAQTPELAKMKLHLGSLSLDDM